jgi:hypothetical protein
MERITAQLRMAILRPFPEKVLSPLLNKPRDELKLTPEAFPAWKDRLSTRLLS